MQRRLMVGFVFSFVIQSLLAQVAAPTSDHPAKPKKLPGNCTVSGRVVSAADGMPLRSARVGLIEASERHHPLVYGATTDSDGHFEIKQIEAGRYNFYAAHIGYLEQRYQAKDAERGGGAVLSLLPEQAVSDVVFRLVRAGVITGRVVDDSGEPMVRITVSVLRQPTQEEREDAGPHAKNLEMRSISIWQTDDRGEYRIFGLKPGEYYIKASETGGLPFSNGMMERGHVESLVRELGSQFAPLYYPGVTQLGQAQAVQLQAGEEMQADFAMRRIKLVEVSGKVIGQDGTPASGAFVHLSQRGVSDWISDLASPTDNKGEFTIKGVPPGNYRISAGTYEEGKIRQTRQSLDVGEDNVDSVRLNLGGGANIHGRVVTANGAPMSSPHAEVVLQPTSEDTERESGFAEVKKDGSFELEGIADGSYAVQTAVPEPGWYVSSIHIGQEDVFQSGLQVDGGAAKGNLEIVVSNDGAQIEGTVTDSDKNQPLVGARVKLAPDPMTDYNDMRQDATSTDQNGHYVLSNVPPGRYRVTARLAASGAEATPVRSEPVAVTVTPREHRAVDMKVTVPPAD